ncbi:hypothetical protein KAR91_88415 [Candidatus Pacearchaeota archaeon]|nr:hypothetical protein [Candidatus Pacearchaeota archaeon]
MAEKKIRTDFYVTQNQFKAITAYAKKHGINNSETFRRIIDAFFEKKRS